MNGVYGRVVNRLSGGRMQRLEESVNLLERKIEDLRWTRVTGTQKYEFSEDERQEIVKRCYNSWQTNPLAAAYTRLLKHFTFSDGVSKPRVSDVLDPINGESLGEGAISKAQYAVDRFWNDRQNQENFVGHGPLGQMSDKSQYEGELFVAIFASHDAGLVRPTLFDSLDIYHVITDPHNTRMELYYRKDTTLNKYDFASGQYNLDTNLQQREYFASLAYDSWAEGAKNSRIPEYQGYIGRATRQDARVYHHKLNCDYNATRGIPPLYRILDWLRVNKEMAEAMATYIQSLARIAWQEKVKGGAAAVEQERQNWQNRQTNVDRLFGPEAGSSFIHNEGIELAPVGINAGIAQVFQTGLRRTLLMVSPGVGIMEHYFGDPSTGNLATAESMELPMVKMFKANQQRWKDILGVVVAYQCSVAGVKGIVVLDWDFPPIVPKQVQSFVKAAVEAALNGYSDPRATSELIMVTLGIKNAEQYVDKMFPDLEAKVEEVSEGARVIRGVRNLDEDLKAILKDLEKVESDTSAPAHIG